jgi:hypothetical protein
VKSALYFFFLIALQAHSADFLTFNVGNVLMQWKLIWPPEPVCPFYKLCRPETVQQVRTYIQDQKPDVVHFQEIWNPADVKNENNQMHQILPKNYKFACGRGAHDLFSICTAWKVDFQLIGESCQSIYRPHGGYLVCTLSRGNSQWMFVNVHGSALEPEDRKLLLEHLWRRFEKNQNPIIVGGDFNTDLLTEDEKTKIPSQFDKVSQGISTTSFGEAIDHIFVAHLSSPVHFSQSHERAWPYRRWTASQGFGVIIDHNPLWLRFD